MAETPNLLFIADFPPSNAGGGSILVSRLLSAYPRENISVLTSARALRLSPEAGRLECRHILFPRTERVGRLGLGRLKELIDWIAFPFLVGLTILTIKRLKIRAMATIAHGDFILATAIASAVTSTPFLIFVHDDWVSNMKRGPSFVKYFGPDRIFGRIARRASRVYVVSPYMKRMLESTYGIECELQMPGVNVGALESVADRPIRSRPVKILYAGNGFGMECIDLLVNVISRDRSHDAPQCELHLYMPLESKDLARLGWDRPEVVCHGWVSQDSLAAAIKQADILFLPFSFREDQREITLTSCPTKLSDYLGSGVPMLISAPDYSSVVLYATENGFAEIVGTLDTEDMANAIGRIAKEETYRVRLVENAFSTLRRNHDLARLRDELASTISTIVRDGTKSESRKSPVVGNDSSLPYRPETADEATVRHT